MLKTNSIKNKTKDLYISEKNNIFLKNKTLSIKDSNNFDTIPNDIFDLIIIEKFFTQKIYNNKIFMQEWIQTCYNSLKDGHHIYWFGTEETVYYQIQYMEKAGFKIKNLLIWKKSKTEYNFIIYGIKVNTKKTKKVRLKKIGQTKRHSDILEFKTNKDNEIPKDLLSFLIKKSSEKDELIASFYNSDSKLLETVISKEKRKFFGINLDDIIKKIKDNKSNIKDNRNKQIIKDNKNKDNDKDIEKLQKKYSTKGNNTFGFSFNKPKTINSFFENKIFNTDSLKILKDMNKDSVDLVLIDPPYGKGYSNNRRNKDGRVITENGIANDDKDNLPFIKGLLVGCYKVLKPGKKLFWFGSRETIFEQIEEMKKIGFSIQKLLIWEKNNHGTGDLFYSYAGKYEFIVYAIKENENNKEKTDNKKVYMKDIIPSILKYKKIPSKKLLHDHQKPTDLLSFLIENTTNKNELVADFCCGSGSTLKASIYTGRKFLGVEIDNDIYNLTIKSMENRFNHTLEEETIGKEFAELFGLEYQRNNDSNVTEIDGLINGRKIELQELKSEYSLKKKNTIIDVVSMFYYKNNAKPRKTIKISDTDINIVKRGKIYTLPNDSLYLIFVKKSRLKELGMDTFIDNLIESENYFFLPLKVDALKKDFDESKAVIITNNKKKLSDTWESAFSIIDPTKYLYTFEELEEYLRNEQE